MSLNEEISKFTFEHVESVLYQIQGSNFQNFEELAKYIESSNAVISERIQKLDDKIETVNDEFVRTSNVFEINNRKRQKEEELLRIERQRILKDQKESEQKLQEFTINPITLVLKQKKHELDRLEQTKSIILDFHHLIKGNGEEAIKIMPLDEKNFSNSALRIYVFKNLLEDLSGQEYEQAKLTINKKYIELKEKILQNFKEGLWNRDTKQIRKILPYCDEYELIEEVSQFYSEQVFKSVDKIKKLNYQMQDKGKDNSQEINNPHFRKFEKEQEGEVEIKNMFFLVQQGFYATFSYKDATTGEINPCHIQTMMGKYSEVVSRKLITYVFNRIIRESLENILKYSATLPSSSKEFREITATSNFYLAYLEIFYDECQKLTQQVEKIIIDERIMHLISTHIQSIFDSYLDTYIRKQLENLAETYEQSAQSILDEISESAVLGSTDYSRDRQKIIVENNKKGTASTFKRIFQDFTIESKKNLFVQSSNDTPMTSTNEIIKQKINKLQSLFMNSSLESIFYVTKKALNRNIKIAKINEIDRNQNDILHKFLSAIEEIIMNLISLIEELVPPFSEGAPPLEPQFFKVIPNINLLLQRVEIMYEEFKKQKKYKLAESIKLDQKKENLINNCGRKLNKVVLEALSSVLMTENSMMRTQNNHYYEAEGGSSSASNCSKVIGFLEKYIRIIEKIPLANYRNNILKNLGMQLVGLLINFYSEVPYKKAGLSKIYMDIAKFKTIIPTFNSQQVENEFKFLRSLIDIYVIRNDENSIEQYLKNQELVSSNQERRSRVQKYVANKQINQKSQKK